MKSTIYPHSPNEIPDEEHFAIIKFKSITIPGDERSRTHPGHGYPESTETIVEYIAFPTETDLLMYIERISKYDTTPYSVISAKKKTLITKTTFSLK
jgi:hypothetical protein